MEKVYSGPHGADVKPGDTSPRMTSHGLKHLQCNAHYLATSAGMELMAIDVEQFGAYVHVITELTLNHNKISTLPVNFFADFKNLKTVDFGHNSLSVLSTGLDNCKKLQSIIVSHNNLTSLPEDIEGCAMTCVTMDISFNPFYQVPDVVWKLTKLKNLDLSCIGLKSLPEEIGQLSDLITLKLAYNGLTSLPESFSKLSQLANLDLSGEKWIHGVDMHKIVLSRQGFDDVFNANPLLSIISKKVNTCTFKFFSIIIIMCGDV